MSHRLKSVIPFHRLRGNSFISVANHRDSLIGKYGEGKFRTGCCNTLPFNTGDSHKI